MNIGKLGKDKDGSIQQSDFTNVSVSSGVTSEPNSPRLFKVTTSYNCVVDTDYEEKNKEYCPLSGRRRYVNISGKMTPTDVEAVYTVEAFPTEYKCLEVPKPVDLLPIPSFQIEAKELESDLETSKSSEIEDAAKQLSDPQQSPSSGESIGSSPGSSSSKGETWLNSREDCEIHWEDLQLREEIGQGKA